MQQYLLQLVFREFGLQVIEQRSPLVLPQPVPYQPLGDRLEGMTALIHVHTNEKTRAELLVAPILLHLVVLYPLHLACGPAFDACSTQGLSGTIDHVVSRATASRSPLASDITAIVETKSTERGFSHCLVQMVAAQQCNDQPSVVYGVVTTRLIWRFLKLEETTVTIDLTAYPLLPLEPLLALLVPMLHKRVV
jgi:hypothetical protein